MHFIRIFNLENNYGKMCVRKINVSLMTAKEKERVIADYYSRGYEILK